MVMMMERDIVKKLKLWKNKDSKKPLIIKGARQVGKTYAIRQFAKACYKDIIEINFERDLEFVDLFESTRNPKDILNYLQIAFLDKELNEETLFFMDEIQACSQALTALKFLAEEFPCDIICSGSMLGVAIATTSSFPVGYVETWDMYPMGFIEFLKAMGMKENMFSMLKKCLKEHVSIPEPIHNKMNELFKSYMIVGGMPEVVSQYAKTKSYKDALLIQRRIVGDYLNDMAKYAQGSDRIKARECFQSIPLQLAKENKKFQYKLIKEGGSARYYESCLNWLSDSGLILPLYRLKTIQKPIEAYKELSIFKVYMADTGLLVSQFDEAIIKELLQGELGVFKGALYENITMQLLNTCEKKAYYYQPTQISEIDFIIYFDGEITPLEIKSGKNTVSKSFTHFVREWKPKYAFRLSQKNIGENSLNIQYIPLYLLEFLLQEEKSL